jgi:outer membrane protein
LSVPIFNGWQTETNIVYAKLNLENAKYNLQLEKNNLRKDINSAHANAKAALKKYNASELIINFAFKNSFKFI